MSCSPLTPAMRSWLVDNCGLPSDADEDWASQELNLALRSERLSVDEFITLLADDNDDIRPTIQAMVAEVLTNAGIIPDNTTLRGKTMSNTDTDAGAVMVAGAKAKGIREIHGTERYSTTKEVGKHKTLHRPVETEIGGPYAMQPSSLELAKLAVYFKWVCAMGKLNVSFTDHEKSILHDILTRDTWKGISGEDTFVRTGHPGAGVKADLLSDTTSGGEYLVPEWYDAMLIHYPLLHSELLPHVLVREVTHGNAVAGAAIDNVTMTSDLTDGTPATPFDCTDLVVNFDTTLFDSGCFIAVGKDLLEDVGNIVNLGADLLMLLGQSWMSWLDEQIAIGDGSTEPEGLFTASGTTSVASANGTAGPFTAGDIEALCFGLGKQYRIPSFAPAYVTADTMYRRARQVPVSTADARRIFGMDHQAYTLLEYPVKIQNNITNGSIGFGCLSKYRLYKRSGPQMKIETGGKTLALANQALVYLRGRVGGRLSDPSAFAKMTDAPVVDA